MGIETETRKKRQMIETCDTKQRRCFWLTEKEGAIAYLRSEQNTIFDTGF